MPVFLARPHFVVAQALPPGICLAGRIMFTINYSLLKKEHICWLESLAYMLTSRQYKAVVFYAILNFYPDY
jgi:hypothetical protein